MPGGRAGAVPPAADRDAEARAAFEAGRAAAEPVARLRWLDRAHRLCPADPTLCLALAEACLGHDDARAESLLASLVAEHDTSEAWLALAAARSAMGDASGAAMALARSLSRYAMPPGLYSFADAVAQAAGALGWCAMQSDGGLIWGPAGCAPKIATKNGQSWVTLEGNDLLGSPLIVDRLTRVEGFVQEGADGGLEGWAWLPANPEINPVLRILTHDGEAIRLIADRDAPAGDGLLGRRRAFAVPVAMLAGLTGPFRVVGDDGKDLLGSPVLTGLLPAPPRPFGGPPGDGGIDVIVPVHGARDSSLACIDSVLASDPPPGRLIVIDDASEDRYLARALDALASTGRIVLRRHRRALSFPSSANVGLRMAAQAGHHAVLLNSDTLVPPGWLGVLRACAEAAPDIGTVTPLSNSGGIVSYPGPDGSNPIPDLAETRRFDRLARRANRRAVIDIPVGVGFCLLIRNDCLRATGLLRTDVFAQGYGEENDFCLRATQRGFRHVAALGVFVAHIGGQSFGRAARDLRERNARLLECLHPGYDALIARHLAADPLAATRRRVDRLRFRAVDPTAAVLLVSHDQGGGVERVIASRVEAARARGHRPLVLRPGGAGGARLSDPGIEAPFPNLAFAMPTEMAVLRQLLASERLARIEFHHLLGHHPGVLELPALLGVPYDVHVHDHAWFCPRVLLLEGNGRYCGEPPVTGCIACIARAGSLLDEPISPPALRARSAHVLKGARRVVVPSADAASRLARHFPGIRPAVEPHEDDAMLPPVPPPPTGRCRIVVVGAIGEAKGYDVLLRCARDAARRRLDLEFVVVGHTIGDATLMAAGPVFVTGPFDAEEATGLIRAQGGTFGFVPSVVPETWCFALTDLWRAGLRAAVFDLGAQAMRVGKTGWGFCIPHGTNARQINDTLLAAGGIWRHEGGPRSHAKTGS